MACAFVCVFSLLSYLRPLQAPLAISLHKLSSGQHKSACGLLCANLLANASYSLFLLGTNGAKVRGEVDLN